MLWEAERKCPMLVPYDKVLRLKKRPFEQREFIFTVSEIARTLGLSEMSIYRYIKDFPTFPKPITFKATVSHWARRHGIPFKRGPLPSEIRRVVVRLRGEGKTFREIGKIMGISHQAAHQHWKRHNRALSPRNTFHRAL